MSTEHQPGSPGVDLDHLDFLHAEATSGLGSVAGKMKRFENFSFALMNQWGAISAELRTLRARVAELEAEARMWSATAEENEAAIRHLVSIIDRDGGQLQQGDPPVSAAARAGCSVHVLHDRAESAEARIAALEKLFDDAGQGNYNVLALIDHYQSEAMAESERRREAEARVKELEAWVRDLESDARADAEMLHKRDDRIAELESQLAAAREEQGLEAKVREVLGERFFQVRIGRYREFWLAEWREVVRGETLERFANAETLSALLRAILEVEAKS